MRSAVSVGGSKQLKVISYGWQRLMTYTFSRRFNGFLCAVRLRIRQDQLSEKCVIAKMQDHSRLQTRSSRPGELPNRSLVFVGRYSITKLPWPYTGFRKHSIKPAVCCYAAPSNACQVCSLQFSSRDSLCKHLTTSYLCLLNAVLCFPPLSS